MSLFNFFRNTLHEVTIVKDDNYPNAYSKGNVICKNYSTEKKKELFTSVKNMTIVTPSKWLANLVKESFLGKYPVEVINNGIGR